MAPMQTADYQLSIVVSRPAVNSRAAREENEEMIVSLIQSLIRRCELEGCDRILPRHRKRFCTDKERTEYFNFQRKLKDISN
jgi:hypothetical protein